MKTTTLILALALAATTGGAFAQTGDSTGSSTAEAVQKFFAPNPQTLRWEQEDAAQKAKLESEGFEQYAQ